MKVGIVGTSRLTDDDERDVRQYLVYLLTTLPKQNLEIVSGGAKGVDSISIEMAASRGISTTIFHPKEQKKKYFFLRNKQIAEYCDVVYCITTPTKNQQCYHHPVLADHEKTAGCWTARFAKGIGKDTILVVTPKR